jgi:hypothetical protein
VSKAFDSKEFLARWKGQREKEEWLFAIAVVEAGLEREGNLDEKAEREIAEALREFDITRDELDHYLSGHRDELLRFLDSNSADVSGPLYPDAIEQ